MCQDQRQCREKEGGNRRPLKNPSPFSVQLVEVSPPQRRARTSDSAFAQNLSRTISAGEIERKHDGQTVFSAARTLARLILFLCIREIIDLSPFVSPNDILYLNETMCILPVNGVPDRGASS